MRAHESFSIKVANRMKEIRMRSKTFNGMTMTLLLLMALLLLLFTSVSYASDYEGDHFFLGYELFEMSMNNFKNYAGEVGYRFDRKNELRLSFMDVILTERHLSNSYEAHATNNNGNVKGHFQAYELNYDRFFSEHWYFMANLGWFHDYFQNIITDESLENKTITIGSGLGYKYENLFGVSHLYANLSYPVRYYLHPIHRTWLGNTLIMEHIIVDNLWLFIGYAF